jgi:hypothetical protein
MTPPDKASIEFRTSRRILARLLDSQPAEPQATRPVGKLRLLVKSARLRLSYACDRQFAVSLSGSPADAIEMAARGPAD